LKPRVLIILNRFVVGGQSIDTVPLANELKDEYEVLIAYGEKENDEEEFDALKEKYNDIAFKKISSLKRSVNPLNDLCSIFALCKLIKKFDPVIVHTHGSKPGVNGRIAAWLAKVPCIIHTFHGHLFHSYYNKFISSLIIRLEKFLSRISSKIIVLSEEQHEEIIERYKIAKSDKIKLIPLGVDEMFYNTNTELLRSAFRNKYFLSDDCIAIGIIGRIVPVKNHKFFVEVVSKLLQSSVKSKIKFFIVGDGYSKNEIKKILTNYNIEWSDNKNLIASKVIFTSWITPVTQVLQGLDIVVLTSLNEGTPLSIIEAQVCAKPVVATNVGGVKDTFINNESGFLITDHDLSEFVNKLKLLAENNEIRKKMGCAGQAFAKKNFSKQAEVNAFKDLYSDCVSSVTNR
jgi:glycosyltransferase involved in cell wall biosynthesis